MARWGNCDYKQLQQLRENLEKLQSMDLDKFCRDASKELAARLLALVIPRTPVGQYPKASGKKGGTLRRGWTAKTHDEAASGRSNDNPAEHTGSLPVSKSGSTYTIEVINPVEYASYVEFGHRTPGGNGWVAGRYFLTKSEEKLRQIAPAAIQKKLDALLREAFKA